MDPAHPGVWLIVAVAAAATLGVLHVIASAITRVTMLQDLKVEAIRLRLVYLAQIRALEVGLDPRSLPEHDTDMLLRFLATGDVPGIEVGEAVEAEDGEQVIEVSPVNARARLQQRRAA